MTLKTSRPFK